MKAMIIAAALTVATLLLIGALAIGTGAYNVAADDKHSSVVHSLIETTREQSIAARTDAIAPPNLEDAQQIRRGAGNYDAMCVGCHLAPGVEKTEISEGLYP